MINAYFIPYATLFPKIVAKLICLATLFICRIKTSHNIRDISRYIGLATSLSKMKQYR